MSTFTKDQEHFIQYEVNIRIHDHKFQSFEKRFDRMESKLNWIIGIVLTSVIIPVGLHLIGLV